MPEVRRFFYDSVLHGDYGNKLRVQFIPGAMPELVLFGADKQEIAREDVSGLNFDQLHELVQAKGFIKLDASEVVALPALASDEDVFGDAVAAGADDDYWANNNAAGDADDGDSDVDPDEAEFHARFAADAEEEEAGGFPDGQEEAAAEEAELARSGSGSAEL